MKRAQILVADLWACFDGQGFGQFDDIDSITIFADYRVPQALVYFGLIEYSPSLMQHLKEQETDASRLFKNGESLEVQIRGCSIWTAELLRQKIAEKITLKASSELSVPNAILLDFYIWDFVYKNKALLTAMNIPFHRVRCIYY